MSNKLANIIIDCDAGKPEYRDWYIYYIEQKVSQILTYVLLLLIASFLGSLIEASIFLSFWVILRSATGGYHANTRICCFFMSSGIFAFGVWGFPYILTRIPHALIVTVVITISIVFFCAPVIHPNLLQEPHHNKKMRWLSILFLAIEYFAVGIGLLAGITLNYIMAACNAMFLSSILLLIAKIIKQEGKVLYESQEDE